MGKKIGFISTRFAGIDGVSLESSKWAEVLEKVGYTCFWFAGELDRDTSRCFLVPEAHFQNDENKWINEHILGRKVRDVSITDLIHDSKRILKNKIYEYVREFGIEILIVENALSIPMHIPLGVALAEVICAASSTLQFLSAASLSRTSRNQTGRFSSPRCGCGGRSGASVSMTIASSGSCCRTTFCAVWILPAKACIMPPTCPAFSS